jgi:hypothetical protein
MACSSRAFYAGVWAAAGGRRAPQPAARWRGRAKARACDWQDWRPRPTAGAAACFSWRAQPKQARLSWPPAKDQTVTAYVREAAREGADGERLVCGQDAPAGRKEVK